MEYIFTEMGDRNFIIAQRSMGAGRYAALATCRSRAQTERIVALLNKSDGMSTVEMVAEFHEAFGIDSPKGVKVPGLQHQDVQDWLKEEGAGLLDTSKRVKEACASYKKNGLEVAGLLRMQLMVEELGEVLVAMASGKMDQVLHELADLRYVADGTALACGLGSVYEKAVAEIHRANMSKLDEKGKPVIGASGRVEKSKLFKKADVKPLLEAA